MTIQIERSLQYRRYLNSSAWHKRRRQRLIAADNMCEFRPEHEYGGEPYFGARCCSSERLEVHHLHYSTLGHELDSDLEVLCKAHHVLRHVMQATCSWCEDSIFYHEDDARYLVEDAVERYGISNLNLDDIDVPSECSHCDHMLSKDD